MNRTNRFLNRALLFVVGLVLLVAGAGTVAVLSAPAVGAWWTGAAAAARTWWHDTNAATTIAGSTISWLQLGVLAAIVLVVVLLVVLVSKLGGGRTGTLLRPGGLAGDRGRITVDAAFVSDAVKHSLQQRDEILRASVSASDFRTGPVMHVSVTPRQNTSPRQVADDLDVLLTNLTTLTGSEVPTYLSIHSGLRSRIARDQRRLT